MAQLHGTRYERNSVECIFQHLDLDPGVLSRPVRTYSKGMAQKLGLATCFLSRRELLVLDEPMSGLDPKARALFKDYLLQARDERQTLFFTTHLLNDVDSLCDRLAILHQGEVRFIGSPEDCCERFSTDSLEHAYLKAIETGTARRPGT
jgi:ABC-2 type transport system ATP-binding protein